MDYIHELAIIGGLDKAGSKEEVEEIRICPGEIIGIVGPTGSGKSTLIADIEQIAQEDTITGRKILVNGAAPPREMRTDPRKKRIAQLSQKMHFLADMTVMEFLRMHSKSRNREPDTIGRVITLANTLTGEPIRPGDLLTTLSGGQSRALMVADIAVISDSPIVLIDEIENAGIKKQEGLTLLASKGKIVLVATHDPVLALMARRRIVMKNGGMRYIITSTAEETRILNKLVSIDSSILKIRDMIRDGGLIKEIGTI